MTALDDHPQVYRPGDDDFWLVLLPEAARCAIDCGYASAPLLQRRMRVDIATAQQLVDELADAGIVGSLDGPNRLALVDHGQAAAILAGLADPDQPTSPPPSQPAMVVDLDDDQIEATNHAPQVSLTKPANHPATTLDDDQDDEPGGELVVRPDDDLATYQPGQLEPWRGGGGGSLGGRVQETWWRVIDHPTTTRTGAVTRQLPKAGLRLAVYTPRGAARLVGMAGNALFATRTAAMVARIADTDPMGEAWVKASAEHGKVHERLAARRWLAGGLAFLAVLVAMAWWAPTAFAGILAVVVFVGVVAFARGVCRDPKELATCVAVATAGAVLAWFTGPDLAGLVPRPNLPWWGWLAVGVVGVAFCGWHGRHEDQPLIQSTNWSHKPPPITASMVIDALCRIGVPGMTLAATDRVRDEIRVRSPGVGHSGRGYTIELELPPGVTAASVMENREELAGALRRKLGCVWPSRGPDHPGHLRLFLSHVPMATAPQPDWPHAGGTAIDSFEPFELVTDQEGEWVKIQPAGTHTVIAGASGFGKSVVLRHLAVALAFDPRARLYCFDGKISGDLDPIRKIAHAYYEGAEEEDVDEQLAAWRGIEKEMRRRAKFLRNLPPEERSSKVTSTLATKYPHLAPVFVLVDECFPAGTLIGDRRIEDIQAGDLVPSWDEEAGQPCYRNVVGVMRRRPEAMVRIHFADGSTVECTPNHPLMTRGGWAAAGTLTRSTEVLSYAETRRAVHRAVLDLRCGVGGADGETALLEDRGPVRVLEGLPRKLVRGPEDGSNACREGAYRGVDEAAEPDAERRNPGQGVDEAARDEASTFSPGWQRAWDDGATTAAGRGAGSGVGDGVRGSDSNGPASGWPADALQVGHRAPGAADRSRGGWGIARRDGTEGAGRTEDGVPGWARVESVEVLEPGGDGRYGGVCPDGLVYNFEVEGTHTYLVGPQRLVAHNCQEYTEYGTKGVQAEMKLRAEFRTIITRISRLGRSAAIHLVLASQKPDAEVLPTAIMGNCSIRLCFKVTEQNHNDQVLGTGAYKQGLKATLFSTDDRGLAWLKAAGDPQVVRGWSEMVDLQTAYDLIDIAYRMRVAKGLLTGQAADDGIEDAEIVYDVVEDAERVMSARGVGKAQWGELVVWLQELRPGQYAGLTDKELSAAIHGDGIRVRDVRSSGSVKRGVYISDLRKRDEDEVE